jgi:hypothetical protein
LREILMEGDRGWMESTRITARPTEGPPRRLQRQSAPAMVATSGGTALLIRLAITGRRAELADKERQQAAIAPCIQG